MGLFEWGSKDARSLIECVFKIASGLFEASSKDARGLLECVV